MKKLKLAAGMTALALSLFLTDSVIPDLATPSRVNAEEVRYDEDGTEIIHMWFTYHFETNGGDPLEDLVCDNYVQEVWAMPNAVKTGYNFRGWYTDPTLTQKYNYSDLPENGTTMTLYAKWEAVGMVSNETIYTITYELNGGHFLGGYTTQFRNGDVVDIPNPTRKDYNFGGWYLDQNFTQPFTGTVQGLGSFTLYAKWTDKTVIPLLYVLNGGDIGDTDYVTEIKEGANTVLPKPSRVGYSFDGWFTDSALTSPFSAYKITGEEEYITLYAGWTRNTSEGQEPTTPGNIYCLFTLHANGGTCGVETVAISQGETLYLPQPTKTGYTFEGWYMDEALTRRIGSQALAQGSYDLYAAYSEDIYKVMLVLNGTTVDCENPMSYTYASGLSLPTPKTSSSSLTFTGWYYDRTLKQKCGGFAPYTTTGAYTLYAGVMYNGTPNITIGSTDNGNTTTQTITYTDPKTGLTVSVDNTLLNKNIVLYGGVPEGCPNPNPTELVAGDTVTLQAPSREHYLFKGWYTDDTYEEKVTSISFDKESKYVTVYAKWEYMYLNLRSFSVKNVKKKTLKLAWGKLKHVDGYQVQISLNKKYNKAKKYKTKTYTYKKSVTSAKIKSLKKGKKYYVRIRGFGKDSTGKNCYGEWSVCSKPIPVSR